MFLIPPCRKVTNGITILIISSTFVICTSQRSPRVNDHLDGLIHNHDFVPFHHNEDFHRNYPSLQHHHHHEHSIYSGEETTAKPPVKATLHGFPSAEGECGCKNETLIPLDFLRRFDDYIEVNDLLGEFVEGEPETQPLLTSRFGEADERSSATVPKAAGCMPELQTVKIATSDDPSVLYIPSCTRIERCGGCCSHALLTCQPKDTETVSFQVVKTQFMGGAKLKYVGKEVVLVEKHTKCKCDCRVQAEDCNRFQEYRKNECRCACTNTDEEKKCQKESGIKLWNPDACLCQCREIMQCSTGFRYDTNVCKCMQAPLRRRYVETPREERKIDTDADFLPTFYRAYIKN